MMHSPKKVEQNLRTCGRTPTMQLMQRAPPLSRDEHVKSMPTIPSRFEVTLFKGDRERLGFGSKSLKMGSAMLEEQPGPGSYGSRKCFHEDFNERTSWGIRGTGGFASRSQRFGARSLPTMPRPGRGVPGPGAYNQECALRIRDGKDFNQAAQTAVFTKTNDEKAVSSTGPGPGHYRDTAKALAREASAAQSAFRSASRRTGGIPLLAEEVPGPGEYVPDKGSLQNATVPDGPNGEFLATANFKDPSRRKIARIHRDLPAADQQARDVLGEFSEKVSRECIGTLGSAAQMPGPGHYDQDRANMGEGRMVTGNGSSSFNDGPGRTDWAPADAGLMPGPGKYDPQKVVPDRLTSAVSAFNSISDRNKLRHPDAPGPAYYSPRAQEAKKSFRLKSTKDWLA
mmetsp:Transcript_52703/g.163706  ORF Transcript_52703/g.163706 Transcript_52703/m.163706 type:complete len:398 (+) Transcript_52703:3-1196(+)